MARTRIILTILGIAWLWAVSFGAELKVLEGEEAFVFAGEAGRVRVLVANGGGEMREGLGYRLFQASSATLAPVGEREEMEEVSFPPGQTVAVEIPVVAPEARAITSYLVKLYKGEEEIGAVRFRGCPEKLLEGLEKLSGAVALFEPESSWANVFEQQEVPFVDATHSDIKSFEGKLLVARLPNPDAEEQWKSFLPDLPPQASILLLVSPGVTGAELLAPIKFGQKAGQRVAVVQDWFLPALAESPLSQLRLLRVAELLLDPASVKFPVTRE